ncbi:MAG: hypothetical protein OEM02_02815 [Desulfobulbaceae bacterium]|nr:hypothetical protein [Desulfobulbaceae bacterium]
MEIKKAQMALIRLLNSQQEVVVEAGLRTAQVALKMKKKMKYTVKLIVKIIQVVRMGKIRLRKIAETVAEVVPNKRAVCM